MPRYSKSDIQGLLARNKTRQAIDILTVLTEPSEYARWQDELTLHSSKLEALNSEIRKKTIPSETVQIRQNELKAALIAFNRELPEAAYEQEIDIVVTIPSTRRNYALLALLALVGVGFWVWWNSENTSSIHTNTLFQPNDEAYFNVLIIRFEDYIAEASTDCIGRAIEEHLNVIDVNEPLSLPLRTVYADSIPPPRNRAQALQIQARHHSDLVIYGLARQVEDNCAGAEVCFRYGIAEHLKQNMPLDIVVQPAKHDAEYIKTSPMGIEAGQLKVNSLSMKYWISALINFKVQEEEKAFGDLASLTSMDTIGLSDKAKAERYFEVADTYYKIGLFRKSLENIDKAIELESKNINYYIFRGNNYASLRSYKAAMIDFDNVIELDSQSAIGYRNIGLIQLELRKYEMALMVFNKAIKLDSLDAMSYSNRGFTYTKLGKYDLAIVDLDKAISLNPQESTFYNNRGLYYRRIKQNKMALTDYNEAIKLNPHAAAFYSNCGNVFLDLNLYQNAMKNFNKAINLNPRVPTFYNNRGITYAILTEYDLAIVEYNKAIDLDDKYPDVYSNRGLTYISIKEYDRARIDLIKAIDLNPKNPFTYNNLAYAQLKTNHLPKAKVNLEKSQSLDTENSWLYRNWACYYLLQKQEDKALANLEKAIDLGYDDKEWLEEEVFLDPIRKHPRFVKLMEGL